MKHYLLVLLVACGDDLPPPDDGFGQPCESVLDGRPWTSCETETGATGICAVGTCRRFCLGDGTQVDACPDDQRAIPTVADLCWCEP